MSYGGYTICSRFAVSKLRKYLIKIQCCVCVLNKFSMLDINLVLFLYSCRAIIQYISDSVYFQKKVGKLS